MKKVEVIENSNEQSFEVNDNVSKANILSYGAGGIAATINNQLKTGYLLAFMSDIAKLSVASAGFITSLMIVWDAINDPIIAMLSDRTNTKKFGKYRPWMLIGGILTAITTILMFLNPKLPESGLVFYFGAVLFVFSWSQTMFTVPWQALNVTMSADVNHRNLLLTSRQLFGFIGGLFVSITVMAVVNRFGGGEIGWRNMAIITAVIGLVSSLICVNGVKSKDYYNSIPTPKHFSFKTQLRVVFKNKALICASLIIGLLNLSVNITNALNIYYLRYVFGSTAPIAITGLLVLLISLIVIPFAPRFIRKFGKLKPLVFGYFIYLIYPIVMIFLKSTYLSDSYQFNQKFLIIHLILLGISNLGFTICNITSISLIHDVTDYTEFHFKEAQAGYVNSAITLMKKIFTSGSPIIVGAALSLAGYTNGDNVTFAIKNSILNLVIYPPIIITLLTFIVIKLYPITTEYGIYLREELRKSRSK